MYPYFRIAFLLSLQLAMTLTSSAVPAPPAIVDNLANTPGASLGVAETQAIAQAFTTDDRPYRLAAVTATLAQPGNGTETVEIQLRAHDYAKNKPGPILETWTAVSVTGSTPQNTVRASVAGTVLAADTQYWLVVRALSGGSVDWSRTNAPANAGTGSIGSLLTTTKYTATPIWKLPSSTGIPLFSVTGNPVPPALIVGADAGGAPQVSIFDPPTAAQVQTFPGFDGAFAGGVRVAAADFDGDGLADTLVGAGPGGAPHVKVFRGRDGTVIQSFFVFDAAFNGGVFVAAADVNGDGYPDIIASAGASSSQVKVFSGKSGATLRSFVAFPGTTAGVRVAGGDVNGDGFGDIIVGAGAGLPPQVKVFSGKTNAVLLSFFAYSSNFTGGVFVASGDVNGDGYPDIVTGAGAGAAGGHVKVFSGHDLTELRSFFGLPNNFTSGARVGAGDLDGDGYADIIVGAGPGGSPLVRTFSGLTNAMVQSFDAFAPGFAGGVHVAGAATSRLATLTIRAAGTGSGKVTWRFIHPLLHVGGMNVEQTSLEAHLGYQFELVATPAAGSVFSGWTDASAQIVGFDETSTFRMAPGLTLQANFLPAPFAGLDGAYHGLLVFDGLSTRGYFTARVGKLGSFSVKITVGAATASISAAELLGTGDFQRDIYLDGIGKMRLRLSLNMTPRGKREITGTLVQLPVPGSAPLSASLTANREEFQDGNCPLAGLYTMLLKRVPAAPDSFPGGISGVVVNVTDTGFAKFTSALADGSKIATSFPVAADGTCAVYLPLYGSQGYLAGTLNFRDQTDSDIDGTLTWVKPGRLAGSVYPQGFDGQVTALGAVYKPPAGRLFLNPSGAGSLKLTAPAASVKVAGHPVALPLINSQDALTLGVDNVFAGLPVDPRALNGAVKPAAGSFKGSFKETIQGKVSTFTFSGVVRLPKGATLGEAGATFVRGDRTGAASITP